MPDYIDIINNYSRPVVGVILPMRQWCWAVGEDVPVLQCCSASSCSTAGSQSRIHHFIDFVYMCIAIRLVSGGGVDEWVLLGTC